ncbi:hypothetical protein [Cellulomonas fengjieae]|uniref:DUF222 domain-containing protein n=1 Tax=Cellulomonas fengjieae TaxID=2819978 RepID=A0ABS3SHH9_9CELL|nr:hypothetical protein [Cellulomonas fengjieae]MBO3084944.1 hypothetical protein [Cellulomonas fengjieae]MBO3100691.1 hypothetical protein [Cellulomonas fengjieae]QVI66455.1 hypothetical protein KG102_02275 [Cellulomonas fengjieae]
MPTADLDVADPWVVAWSLALDELELDVQTAEALLRDAHLTSVEVVARTVAWQPRRDLGPLPAPLQVRARAILDRQLETSRRTAEAITRSRRQIAATRALQGRPPEAAAVYVDAEA